MLDKLLASIVVFSAGTAIPVIGHRVSLLPPTSVTTTLTLQACASNGESGKPSCRDGPFTYTENVNGARENIAGVLSENRRVLGMMPRPERAIDANHGGTDGQALFRSMLDQLVSA